MRIVTFLFSLFLALVIGLLVVLNISNLIAMETIFGPIRGNVGLLILFSALLGSLITICLGIALSFSRQEDKKKLKKERESAKLKQEIESDKVRQLEAKIKTLEEALKRTIG